MATAMQIETFECAEVSSEPVDASAEALSIIESLGLEGQKELMCPAKADEQVTRFPYREMLKEEAVVYQTLCPKDSKLKDYTGSAIPLRVLQIAAHASELMPDLELHVWDRDSAIEKDPVLVAERKEGYSLKARYILARWGEECLQRKPLEFAGPRLPPQSVRSSRRSRKPTTRFIRRGRFPLQSRRAQRGQVSRPGVFKQGSVSMSEATRQAIGPNQEKWLKALESGDFEQYRGGGIGEVNEGVESNCCLGVYGRIAGQVRVLHCDRSVAYGGNCGYASDQTVEDLALRNHQGHIVGHESFSQTLAHANDGGKTFAEIAAFCRENPEAVFTEPR